MKLGEFFIDLFVDSSNGELTVGNLINKMGELEVATIGSIGALFELGQKLASFTDATVQTSVGLQNIATLTGVDTEEFQQWIRVAEHVNVSGDDVKETFISMSHALAELRRGKGDLVPLVNIFGVDLSKIDLRGKHAVAQILSAVRNSEVYKQMSESDKTLNLESIHIKPLMARVLNLADNEHEAIATRLAGITEENQQKFTTLSSIIHDIENTIKQIGIDISEWSIDPLISAFKTLDAVLLSILKSAENFKNNPTVSTILGKGHEEMGGMVLPPLLKPLMDIPDLIKNFQGSTLFHSAVPMSAMSLASEYPSTVTVNQGSMAVYVSGHTGKDLKDQVDAHLIPKMQEHSKNHTEEISKATTRRGIGLRNP